VKADRKLVRFYLPLMPEAVSMANGFALLDAPPAALADACTRGGGLLCLLFTISHVKSPLLVRDGVTWHILAPIGLEARECRPSRASTLLTPSASAAAPDRPP
jgi:hypothetical protein